MSGLLGNFDPSVPQSARIYDAWLGGKDHYAADRETATRVIELRPQVVAAAQANRRFLARAVQYVAQRHGVTQFMDIGTGLPTADNTHHIAQRIDPRARVVYVDHDPGVRSASGGRTRSSARWSTCTAVSPASRRGGGDRHSGR